MGTGGGSREAIAAILRIARLIPWPPSPPHLTSPHPIGSTPRHAAAHRNHDDVHDHHDRGAVGRARIVLLNNRPRTSDRMRAPRRSIHKTARRPRSGGPMERCHPTRCQPPRVEDAMGRRAQVRRLLACRRAPHRPRRRVAARARRHQADRHRLGDAGRHRRDDRADRSGDRRRTGRPHGRAARQARHRCTRPGRGQRRLHRRLAAIRNSMNSPSCSGAVGTPRTGPEASPTHQRPRRNLVRAAAARALCHEERRLRVARRTRRAGRPPRGTRRRRRLGRQHRIAARRLARGTSAETRVIVTGFVARDAPTAAQPCSAATAATIRPRSSPRCGTPRELHIWTDVDGVLSADPRAGARSRHADGNVLRGSLRTRLLRRQGDPSADDGAGDRTRPADLHPQHVPARTSAARASTPAATQAGR